VAVVCDGYGNGQHSEVGAQIGARLVAQSLFDVMRAMTERYGGGFSCRRRSAGGRSVVRAGAPERPCKLDGALHKYGRLVVDN
jgi:hypothetical protein